MNLHKVQSRVKQTFHNSKRFVLSSRTRIYKI